MMNIFFADKIQQIIRFISVKIVVEVIYMKYTITLPQEVAEIYNLSAKELKTTTKDVIQNALINYIGVCLKEKKTLN